jgi:hypothetical protein
VFCQVNGYKPLLAHHPWLLPLLVLGGIPAADLLSTYTAATAVCQGLAMAGAAASAHALPVYYLHKALVATVGVLTRRMSKRSHAVEQARMMLHGSLLTWSLALAAAHVTAFLSGASLLPHTPPQPLYAVHAPPSSLSPPAPGPLEPWDNGSMGSDGAWCVPSHTEPPTLSLSHCAPPA